MANIAQKRARVIEDTKGLQVYTNIVAVTSKLKVQSLLDLVIDSQTTVARGHLDQMSVPAQRQLVAELTALVAAIAN